MLAWLNSHLGTVGQDWHLCALCSGSFLELSSCGLFIISWAGHSTDTTKMWRYRLLTMMRQKRAMQQLVEQLCPIERAKRAMSQLPEWRLLQNMLCPVAHQRAGVRTRLDYSQVHCSLQRFTAGPVRSAAKDWCGGTMNLREGPGGVRCMLLVMLGRLSTRFLVLSCPVLPCIGHDTSAGFRGFRVHPRP